VERLPLPADDPVRRRPDITLAKKTLGWEPSVQLREGLLRTIDYFRSSDSALMAPAIEMARVD
jgi:UDP-glucuronate decarboxylase